MLTDKLREKEAIIQEQAALLKGSLLLHTTVLLRVWH